MVKTHAGKSSQCGRMFSRQEHALFNTLIEALKIMKSHREENELRFTWDNLCFSGTHVLVRSNKCYAFEPSAGQDIINYKIHGNYTGFEHNPIFISLHLGPALLYPSYWKISTYFLQDLKPQLQALWASQPGDAPFFNKFEKVVRFYGEYCKQ